MIAERYIIRKQQSLGSKNMSIGPATCWHQHTLAHPMCLLGCSAGSRTGSSANVQSSFSNPGPRQAPCVACENAPSPSENAPERLITSTPWETLCLIAMSWHASAHIIENNLRQSTVLQFTNDASGCLQDVFGVSWRLMCGLKACSAAWRITGSEKPLVPRASSFCAAETLLCLNVANNSNQTAEG